MHGKLAVAGLVALVSAADARPSVTVAGDVQLSERDLAEAVELRTGDDIQVRVTREADGRLVIEVGGRTQRIEVDPRDPQSAARVVAMVAVSLIEVNAAPVDPSSDTVVVEDEDEVAPGPRPSRFMARVVPIGLRDDAGGNNVLLTASFGYHLSRHVRVVASIGTGTMSDNIRRSYVFPLRFGFEATAAGLGLEAGGFAIPYLSPCGGGRTNGVYAAARKYIPFSDKGRALLEAGAYQVLGAVTMCFEPPGYQSYAGWIGLGVEWSF